jgi:hypothetical protein
MGNTLDKQCIRHVLHALLSAVILQMNIIDLHIDDGMRYVSTDDFFCSDLSFVRISPKEVFANLKHVRPLLFRKLCWW